MNLSLRILYFMGGFLANSVLLRLHGVIDDTHIVYPATILGITFLQIVLYECLPKKP